MFLFNMLSSVGKSVVLFVVTECPLPLPTFSHAHKTSNPVKISLGESVKYACNRGYIADGQSTSILCDKDPSSQGVKWTGNFTCRSK